ncbi:glycosyltransferase family 2 protein [Escherichia coli]|uniref:glycosyltransferase family 2 protein n=1 Tax=Escherichia coli TaxID=562 RepID=UPI001FA6B427|nr:glycosyltransferase family A protein [Escherichia coli]MCI4609188.1 glycosyltransferase family 2 protein [Escherichia coli]
MISIIITVFNRQETIEAAIESCLTQDFSDYEVIIVDDGSTDQSSDKIKKYIGGKVRYFYQNNQGAAAAKNRGVKEARYEYITFLDSDDVFYSSNVLSRIFSTFDCNPDFICADRILIRKRECDTVSLNKQICSDSDFYKNMILSPLNYAGHNPYVFRKKMFLQIGGFDVNSKWGDALIFWRRFFKHHPKTIVIKEVGYIYNQVNNDSISRKRNSEYYLKALDVIYRCYLENKKDVFAIKGEKNWELIMFYYAIKAKSMAKSIEMFMILCSGRFYFIPKALKYLFFTKVMK